MTTRRFFKRAFYLLGFLFLAACGQKAQLLTEEEQQRFRQDRLGCEGERKAFIQKLRENKDIFLEMTDLEVRQQLGSPNREELYTRTQKFFVYYLEAGPQCENQGQMPPRILQLRLSAVNRVNEAVVLVDRPKK